MMPSRTVADGPVCAQPDQIADLWFTKAARREAVALCKTCPVRAECLVASLDQPIEERKFGVWGGMIPSQRQKIKVRYGTVTVNHARELLEHVA